MVKNWLVALYSANYFHVFFKMKMAENSATWKVKNWLIGVPVIADILQI